MAASKTSRTVDDKGRKPVPMLLSIFIDPKVEDGVAVPELQRIDLDSAVTFLSDGERAGHKREALLYSAAIKYGIITEADFAAVFATFEKVIDAQDWLIEQIAADAESEA